MKLAADGSMTSSFAKFLSEDEIAAIKERAGAKENDLLFVVAGRRLADRRCCSGRTALRAG
ncbi:MAG: GAD domain-containing protein [Butyricicoccaceae bacterium]